MAEWKPVPEWEGLYEVSDNGHVRSVAREVTVRNAYGRLATTRKHATSLSPYPDHKARPTVILYDGKRRVHRRVADLVEQAFGAQHA